MALHPLEETTKHVVVIEEVSPPHDLMCIERALKVEEHCIQAVEHHWARARRHHPGAPFDDLQPLLDVHLKA